MTVPLTLTLLRYSEWFYDSIDRHDQSIAYRTLTLSTWTFKCSEKVSQIWPHSFFSLCYRMHGMYRGGLSKNVAIQCKPGGHCSLPCETLDRQHVRCGVAKGCRRAPVLQVMQSTGRKGQPSQIWQPVFVSKSGAVTHLSEGTQGSGTHPYKNETFRLNIEIKGLLFHFTYNSWDVFFFFFFQHTLNAGLERSPIWLKVVSNYTTNCL